MAWWRRSRGKADRTEEDSVSDESIHVLARARDRLDQGDLPAVLDVTHRPDLPPSPELLHVHALALVKWRRFCEARSSYAKAEHLGLSTSRFVLDIAWCDYLLGHYQDAIQRLLRLGSTQQQDPEIPFAAGVAYMGLSEYDNAIAKFQQALEISHGYPDSWLNIAACYHAEADNVRAEPFARKAVAASPSDARPLALLGAILGALGHEPESLATLREARDLEIRFGSDDGALRPLVSSLLYFGHVQDAVNLCAENLGANPDPAVHALYALALLTKGYFQRGWDQYEYRWLGNDLAAHRAHMVQPPWMGQPLAGKTILLRAEQGFGDAIQFARYAIPLKRMGATVVLSVFEGLLPVAGAFVGPDRVVAKGERFTEFDFHIPLMSLPRVLGQEIGEQVPVPYLDADPSRRERWRQHLSGSDELTVGLVWAGNSKHVHDARRSIPIQDLIPLWRTDGVQFVSLQKELRPGDLEWLGTPSAPKNLGPELADFADTAAVISELDLVICVDTAVAHLAGALGKDVWVLLPKVGDFRWGEGGSKSSWYPTMRLFRQSSSGEWGAVIDEVRSALARWVADPKDSSRAPTALPKLDRLVEAATVAEIADTLYGVVQYFPGRDDIAKSIAALGEYMQSHLELLSKFIGDDSHILEVGAGIGVHTLGLARCIGARGHLMVCEGDPLLRKVLQHNLIANNVTDGISIPRGSLGDDSHLAGTADELRYSIDQLALERLDVLKIGTGLDPTRIMQGAQATLYRLRPLVFAATSQSGIERLSEILRDAGYRCWRLALPLYRRSNYYGIDEAPNLGEPPLAVLAIPEERHVEVDLAEFDEINPHPHCRTQGKIP